MWLLVLQRISYDFLLHILYFPVWWYTLGLKRAFLFAWGFFKQGNTTLAPGLWLKNMFVPMYGQRDFQGRVASIFIRLANAIFRGAALLFWLVVCVGMFAVWVGLPLFVAYMFVTSFGSGN